MNPNFERLIERAEALINRIEAILPQPISAPAWDAAINAGKESVSCDLRTEEGLTLVQALVDRADVVVDGFRPGVLERLGVGFPERAVVCAITGFGQRSGAATLSCRWLIHSGSTAMKPAMSPPAVNASSPHSYQSTGLSLCCRRYGDEDRESRFTRPWRGSHRRRG